MVKKIKNNIIKIIILGLITMANLEAFDKGFNKLLQDEGFISNDKDDRGGYTKYGLSSRSYGDKIEGISLSKAKEIYKNDFWFISKCDEIKSDIISIKVFNTSVNVGVKRSIKFLQKAINDTIKHKKLKIELLKVDGMIGQKTINTVNKMGKYNSYILNYFILEQSSFYIKISKKFNNIKYLRGWLKRASSLISDD